jgi:hypothetical protein
VRADSDKLKVGRMAGEKKAVKTAREKLNTERTKRKANPEGRKAAGAAKKSGKDNEEKQRASSGREQPRVVPNA